MTTTEHGGSPRLPSGLLTFLFTDVVDSTVLWERVPGLMDAALSRHEKLIEASVDAHGGILLKHRGEGDSTFCVFERAADAAAAAIDVQRRIVAEVWDPATPMKVRMGIHSGESILRGQDYFGRTVNRAARVRAVARGGQVLLSNTAAELVGDRLPEETELRFLRHEVLRGIERIEAIHELVDLRRQFEEQPVAVTRLQPPLPREIASGVHSAFAGRDESMAFFESVRARSMTSEPPQLVLLDGEPGVGKKTLACAAAQDAYENGWTALFGACSEDVNVPFEPFREILSHLVEVAPMKVLAAHVTEHGGEVGRLTSKLGARVGALPPVDALDPETTRQLLVEAVADLLLRAADGRPLMLVLDSIHWADHSTLSVLSRLMRAHAHPLVIIGTNETRQSGAPDRSPPLAELRAIPASTTIEVQPFDEAQVVAVLEQAAGHSLREDGPALARHLVEETGGNALFVAELVRYFAQIGVIRIERDGTWHLDVPPSTIPTPPGVRAVIQHRLDRLGDGVERTLGAAAVAGRSFESDVIAAVLDVEEMTVLDALEEAAERSLVREVGVARFEFTNSLVRQTVYDDLGATRRGLWHRKTALTMEARDGDVNPAVLAHHWSATGRNDREKVVEWSHRAGVAALADLAPENAIYWLRTALGAVTSDDRRRLGILIDLGDAQRWAEAEAFRQTLLDAADLAERLGDDDALIRAALANNRGGASAAGTVDTARVAVLERALEVCGPGDSPRRARLLATLAIELSQGPDLERRIAVSDEADAIARRSGDDITLVRVLLLTLEANRIPATLARRMAETDELLTLAVKVGDPVLIGIAALRSLRVKLESGLFDEVDGLIEILDEYARFDPYVLANSASVRAALAHACGELDDAVKLADDALEISHSEADASAVHLTTVAMIKRERGQLEDVVPALEYLVEHYPGVTGFHPLLGLAYLAVGRRDEATVLLQHEIDTELADHPMNPLWMASVGLVALLAIGLESTPAAEMLRPVLEPWRGRPCTTVISYNGFVNEILGHLALLVDDLDEAEDDFNAAIEQAERIGARVCHVRSRLGRSRVLAGRGDRRGAIDEARAVETTADEIGMTAVADEARRMATRWETEARDTR